MQEWLKISGLLCIFGFIRDIRPSEPYVTEYILGWKNVTQEQLIQEVFPVATYSYLAQLIVVFLITDFFRYKPLIVVIGISGIIVWSILIWTTSLVCLQILEFFYGTYMAAEVAYFTYIYAKVDKKYYPKVTSHTRAALLIGKLVASVSSQILISYKWMDFKELNYITLSTQVCATFWALTLPGVKTSLYFHRKTEVKRSIKGNHSIEAKINYGSEEILEPINKFSAFKLLWTHFVNAYTNIKVIQWSIWYSVALAGHLQIVNYIQVLWKDIDENPPVVWNGAVDAVLTLSGAILALLAGYLHSKNFTSRKSLIILAFLSISEGGAILLATWSQDLYLSYVGYIIFGALYAFTITVASAEVAKHLEQECYGLVFGINTLIALGLQAIITVIFVSGSGFILSVSQQFTVYSFYFIIIGVIFFVFVVVDYFLWKAYKKNTRL